MLNDFWWIYICHWFIVPVNYSMRMHITRKADFIAQYKEAESVRNLKRKFIQRVPKFENINADFLSMTLERLMGVIIDGKVYR